VIYLFAIGLPMSAVGAFATLAEHPLYPFYAAARGCGACRRSTTSAMAG